MLMENPDKNNNEDHSSPERKSSIDERKARRKQLNLRENLSP